MANILGYSSFSEYKLSDMMAKTPETVFNFLDNIKDKLQPLVQQEFAKKLELKMTDMAELNEVDDKLNYWDINYYDRYKYILNDYLYYYYFCNYYYY